MRLLPLIGVVVVLIGLVVEAAPARAAGLRVMTYNLNYGNPTPATAIDAIAKADVDIVLLQEVTDAWKALLERRLAPQYPHRAYRVDRRAAGGAAVLSKHAIAAEELWAPPAGTGAWFPAQRMVVTTPLGTLQILNVHLRPALKGGSWVKGFLETPPIRRAEIEAHWKQLDRKLPTIIAGDFNEDPWGRAVDFLEHQGLVRVPVTGPTTWHYESSPGKDLLKLDIDHVMIDGTFTAKDGHVIDAGASDHRPVVVTIERKP